jgi:hypothetical protein
VKLVNKQTELYETYKKRILEARAPAASANPTAAGG